jgi:hypothetical protein
MLRKLIASVLVILSALPFTAPFATVDMPTLLSARASTLPDQISLTPLVEDGSHALVAPAARLRVRVRSVLRLDAHLVRPHDAVPVRHGDRTPVAALHLSDRSSLTSLRI